MTIRKRILEASIIEFGEHGFEGSSTNTIAKKANVSKGSIFHNFINKEKLFESSCLEIIDNMCYVLDRPDLDDIENPIDYYFELRRCYFDEYEYQEKFFYRILWDDRVERSDIISLAKNRLKKTNERYIRVMFDERQLRPDRTIDEAITLVEELQAILSVKFFNKPVITSDDAIAYEDYSKKMFDYLLFGLCEE